MSRKESYEEQRSSLEKKCKNCSTRSYIRCDSCIVGKKLRHLESEFSDITGWNHNNKYLWQPK